MIHNANKPVAADPAMALWFGIRESGAPADLGRFGDKQQLI
jgi:hypothetical protein